MKENAVRWTVSKTIIRFRAALLAVGVVTTACVDAEACVFPGPYSFASQQFPLDNTNDSFLAIVRISNIRQSFETRSSTPKAQDELKNKATQNDNSRSTIDTGTTRYAIIDLDVEIYKTIKGSLDKNFYSIHFEAVSGGGMCVVSMPTSGANYLWGTINADGTIKPRVQLIPHPKS